MAWTGGVTATDASESYGYSAAGMLISIAAPELGAQDTVGGVALARSARSAQASQSAQSAGVETRGTLVTRVGKTSYTYDKLGRVTETVTRRSSLKPLVKRFSYAGATGQVTGFSSSDAPGVRWVYSYDGLGRRVAKTCLNTDTGEVVSRQVFAYVGNDLVAEHTTAGDASGVVGRMWVQDPGTGELVGQINLTNNNDAASVSGWSQARGDAVFYALVADLAGAPQELIDTEQGSVVGHVTQSLFGRRSWSGVDSPVLFAGQYEDDESGWVYNRFRFYDPAGGVYGSQDPLGVGPNVGTPQGYVHNPLTWVDALGLKAHQVKDKILKDRVDNLTSAEKGIVGEALAREHFQGQFNAAAHRSAYDSVWYSVPAKDGAGNIMKDQFGKTITRPQGRISDITLRDGSIVEAKFVKQQGMTRQLSYAIYESRTTSGNPLNLVVGEGTVIKPNLQAEIDAGSVNLVRISDSKVDSMMTALGFP